MVNIHRLRTLFNTRKHIHAVAYPQRDGRTSYWLANPYAVYRVEGINPNVMFGVDTPFTETNIFKLMAIPPHLESKWTITTAEKIQMISLDERSITELPVDRQYPFTITREGKKLLIFSSKHGSIFIDEKYLKPLIIDKRHELSFHVRVTFNQEPYIAVKHHDRLAAIIMTVAAYTATLTNDLRDIITGCEIAQGQRIAACRGAISGIDGFEVLVIDGMNYTIYKEDTTHD